jgi:hypothetical protein
VYVPTVPVNEILTRNLINERKLGLYFVLLMIFIFLPSPFFQFFLFLFFQFLLIFLFFRTDLLWFFSFQIFLALFSNLSFFPYSSFGLVFFSKPKNIVFILSPFRFESSDQITMRVMAAPFLFFLFLIPIIFFSFRIG